LCCGIFAARQADLKVGLYINTSELRCRRGVHVLRTEKRGSHLRIATLGLVLLMVAAPAPARAQIDMNGVWAPIFHEDQPERVPGPDIGDYAGLPINDALRLRADTWDASLLTLPEHQCKPHPSTYGFRGVGNLRILFDFDDASQRLIKINTQIQWMEQKREIWMDGRPHLPEYAPHTWQGFSTGRWDGPVLVVNTTHLKAGWIRRNGLALSDNATMEERFIRHGDLLTHVYMISDPVYLTEPLIKTNGFRLQLNGVVDPYPCESVDEVIRDAGVVPNHLPDTSQASEEYAKKHHLSVEGVKGGAETALPEFAKRAAAPASSK
jgi:hypothetical protein